MTCMCLYEKYTNKWICRFCFLSDASLCLDQGLSTRMALPPRVGYLPAFSVPQASYGRDQRCCSTSHNTQDCPSPERHQSQCREVWAGQATVARARTSQSCPVPAWGETWLLNEPVHMIPVFMSLHILYFEPESFQCFARILCYLSKPSLQQE